MQAIADNVTRKYPREALKKELSLKSFEEWVDESGRLAREIAYDNLNLKSGDTITPEYEKKARETIDHQLALGGYRLADALSQMLKVEPAKIVPALLTADLR